MIAACCQHEMQIKKTAGEWPTYPNTKPAPRMKMTPGRNRATLAVYTGRNSAQPFQLFCFSNQASIVPKMLKPCRVRHASVGHFCLN